MTKDNDFINELNASLFIYSQTENKTDSFISATSYNDIRNYIKLDDVLQQLASKKLDYGKKKTIFRNYLHTENIFLWYYFNRVTGPTLPFLSKSLSELLPYSGNCYSPYVNAYLRWSNQIGNLNLDLVFNANNLAKSANSIKNEDLMLESLISTLQDETTVEEENKASKAFNRTKRNLNRYLSDLLSYKANLLVLRLDLAFSKEYLEQCAVSLQQQLLSLDTHADYQQFGKESLSRRDYERTQLSNRFLESQLQEIKEYRRRFFRIIKRKYHLEGFVWKLEYGGEKSYHYHCLIFLNGDKHQEDITIAREMGELWKALTIDQSTNTYKGLYWNCNANKSSYKYLAIGKLNARNTQMIENLRKYVLTYIAKTDYYFNLTSTTDRSLGMGNDKVKVKPGRPRKINREVDYS